SARGLDLVDPDDVDQPLGEAPGLLLVEGRVLLLGHRRRHRVDVGLGLVTLALATAPAAAAPGEQHGKGDGDEQEGADTTTRHWGPLPWAGLGTACARGPGSSQMIEPADTRGSSGWDAAAARPDLSGRAAAMVGRSGPVLREGARAGVVAVVGDDHRT